MRLIDGHKAKKAIHEHPAMRLHKATVLRLLDGVPEIDPVHAAGGCYCGECEYQDDCEKQVTLCTRDHVLEQNIYQHNRLEWCSHGRLRETAFPSVAPGTTVSLSDIISHDSQV